MRRKISVVIFSIFFICFLGVLWAEDLPPLPKGPLMLTSTTSAMLNPGYWIKKIPNAEKPIKTPEQLKHFNDEIRSMIPECVDVFKLDLTRPGKQITEVLQNEYKTLSGRKLFDAEGRTVPKSVFEETLKPLIQIEQVPSKIKMKWGVAVRATSVRALPTTMKMIEAPDDYEFDQLQFTLIKLWTPVGIYHVSRDGKWVYIQAPYVRGWVQAKDIAVFPSRDEMKKYARSNRFLVVTGESTRLFKKADLIQVLLRPSMGTVIPLASPGTSEGIRSVTKKTERLDAGQAVGKTTKVDSVPGAYVVWVPYRKEGGSAGLTKGYINKKSDVTQGYPAYTQANAIRQAFKLLGQRYGWGGMYNGRDCSGFVHDVFLSLGVDLPRDSKQQALIGTQLGFFEPGESDAEKQMILRDARPGITLLKMPHHQMIYLGKVGDQFYVIHSTWAERIGPDPVKDEKRRINQVVVSDLDLNGNSYVGSLFDRIVSMNEVD